MTSLDERSAHFRPRVQIQPVWVSAVAEMHAKKRIVGSRAPRDLRSCLATSLTCDVKKCWGRSRCHCPAKIPQHVIMMTKHPHHMCRRFMYFWRDRICHAMFEIERRFTKNRFSQLSTSQNMIFQLIVVSIHSPRQD
jgi:hypothetical protein